MRRMTLIFVLLVILILAGSLVLAQSGEWAIPWFTVSGGGTGHGESFALSGTVGQPAAGEMSGDAFAISGGYWRGISATASGDGHQVFLPLIVR